MKSMIITSLLLATGFTSIQAQETPVQKVKTVIAPALLRGPYLQAATSNSIVIRWRTDASARSRVKYGTSPDKLDRQTDDLALTTEHKVKLTNLQPGTRYYYSIGSLKEVLQGNTDNSFVTLPEPGKAGLYRIAALGDCGDNSINQRQVKEQLVKYLGNNHLDAWILLGDNAYPDGTDAEYQTKFFNVYKDDLLKKYPLFPAPGNHDYHDTDLSAKYAQETHQTTYYQNFTMPSEGESGGIPSHSSSFYSFDIGNIHFLSLDSYGKEDSAYRLYDTLGPQVRWIKEDLAANKNKAWVVAYWHHPPYTMGSHNSDEEDELIHIRQNFIQVLERNGVDLVLNGHSHDYERSRLIQGHYGMANTFDPAKHNISNSSGRYDGGSNAAPYVKDSARNNGTVYVVSGSAGKLGGKQTTFPHKAMYFSDADHGGATMLEVQDNRLDLKWICADGTVRDQFTIMKNVNKHSDITIKKGQSAVLTASFIGNYKWNSSSETGRSITVTPTAATTKYTVTDAFNVVKDTFTVHVSK
ncbi:purple acid phosphatase-like protein [Chitinophaga polysaccharea]|uniref:Purple acid phosphatase-like protein n=1 Tax=Chitinophaga polysaccharea TaxID=1293035 RepID=A0A561PCK5_9BACT|nr:metallophosphoesterase family protein [Chitinophaga polysaccharea]TWF35800.1 purple acid phosphatase-like protein [Chitinophaga polysaccharea]